MSKDDIDDTNEFQKFVRKGIEVTQYKGSPITVKGKLVGIDERYHNLQIKVNDDLLIMTILRMQ